MFGFVSKKKLINEAIKIYMSEETSKACSHENLMYRMGNANALGGLCKRLGIDLLEELRKELKLPEPPKEESR